MTEKLKRQIDDFFKITAPILSTNAAMNKRESSLVVNAFRHGFMAALESSKHTSPKDREEMLEILKELKQ